MEKIRRSEPQHRAAIDALLPRTEAAFTGLVVLASLRARRPRRRDPEARGLARRQRPHRRRAVRPPRLAPPRPAEKPLSTSPMDGLTDPIRAALHPRRYGLKNRERTNRLLMLMQLHANRLDDPLAYAKDIRAWLEANGGRPRTSRRAVADHAGQPSLR